jgi:cytochrome c553
VNGAAVLLSSLQSDQNMNNVILTAVVLAVALATTDVRAQADAAVKDKAQACAACHGPTGNSTDPQYPILAGQTARYIFLELRDFKAGRRHDPQMDPMAANLTPDDMLALGDYFSKQTRTSNGFKADGGKVSLGAKKSDEVLCTMCHGGGFLGQNEVPRVAGQHYAYIKKQLSDFKARRRTNDAGNMTSVASTLSDADIENLAQYIANL